MKLSVNNPPNFVDSFAENNWTNVGTDYFVGSGRNNFTIKRPNLQDNYNYRDVGFLSDVQWTMRCKLVMTSNTPSTGAGTYLWLVMSSTTGGQQTVQDSLGFGFVTSSVQNSIFVAKSDGAGLDETTGFPIPLPIENVVLGLVTLYFEFTRISEFEARVEIFSDPSFTVSLGRQVRTIPAGITGLRYIKMSSWNIFSSTYDGVQVGYIDDLQIWNNTVPRTPIENVPNFEDNFETNKGWVTTNPARLNVDIERPNIRTSGKIIFNSTGLVTINDVMYFNLQSSISETFWTFRCKITVSNLVVGADTTANELWCVVANNTANALSGQDCIGIRLPISNFPGDNRFRYGSCNNTNPVDTFLDTQRFGPSAVIQGDVFYLEIRRITNLKAEINLYGDSSFTQLLGTITFVIAAGTTALQYIKFFALTGDATADSTFDGFIEDVELWTNKGATKIQDWRTFNG